jgi:CheY-like chemotaxis protein
MDSHTDGSRKQTVEIGRRRILVVDDYEDAAEMTAELLRLNGKYEVRVVYDGMQAVVAARTFHPEIVFLDIDMPVMNGYEAAKRLRLEEPTGARMLLVAFTGQTNRDDVRHAYEAGFDRHVGKPTFGEELRLLVEVHFAEDKRA